LNYEGCDKIPRIRATDHKSLLKWEIFLLLCGLWVTLMTPLMLTLLVILYSIYDASTSITTWRGQKGRGELIKWALPLFPVHRCGVLG